MPLYEYTCSKCGKNCELLIRGEERPICPHCQSRQLEKQVSAPAVSAANRSVDCRPGLGGG